MKNCVKRPLFFVSILALIWSVSLAEIKLRIYLKDGTLQSGNFVTETKENFVILNQGGRVEIPKSKIMFVNGKTLKQWEERPDKFFATEIIPKELPKPGYVNDMATMPIPQPPAVEPVRKLDEVMTKGQPVKPLKVKEKTVEQAKPAEKSPPTPAPAEVILKTAQKKEPEEEKKVQKETPAEKKVNKQEPVTETTPVPVKEKEKFVLPKKKDMRYVESTPARAGRFSRQGYADVHFAQAKQFLAKNQIGRAVQELHYVVLLDRRNEEAAFLLGKLYLEAGVFDRARRVFVHPGLKKNKKAASWLEEMDLKEKQMKKQKTILYSSTAGGVLTMIPLLLLASRWRRKPEARIVIDSDTLPVGIETEMASSKETLALEGEMTRGGVPPQSPHVAKSFKFESVTPAEKPQEKKAPPRDVESPTPAPVAWAPQPPDLVSINPLSIVDEEYERSLSLKVTRTVAITVQKGHQYANEGKWQLASRQYRTAVALDKRNVEAYIGLGYINFMENRFIPALHHYQRACQLGPNNADAHYGVGRVLMELGFSDEAVPELQTAVELDPSLEEVRFLLNELGKAA